MSPPSDIEFGPDSVDVTAATVTLAHTDVGETAGPDVRSDRFGFAPEDGDRSIDINPVANRIRLDASSDEFTQRIDIDADGGGIDLYNQSLSIREGTDSDEVVNRIDLSDSRLGGAGWGHTMTFLNTEGDETAVIDTGGRRGSELRLQHDGEAPVSADEPVGPTLELDSAENGSITLETATDDTAQLRLSNSTGAGVELSGDPDSGFLSVSDEVGDSRITLFAAADTTSAIQLFPPAPESDGQFAVVALPVASIDETGLFTLGGVGEHGRSRYFNESGDVKVQLTAGQAQQTDIREDTAGVFANGRTGELVLAGTNGQLTMERNGRLGAALTANGELELGSGTETDPGEPGSVLVETPEGGQATTIEGRDATLTVGPIGRERDGPVKDGSDTTVVQGSEPGTISVRNADGNERIGLSADTSGTGSDPGVLSFRDDQGDRVCYVRVNDDAVEFVDAATSGEPVVFRIENGEVEAPNQNDV